LFDHSIATEKPIHIGKYQILGELGRGAMGVVYQGFDPDIGRQVAIKTLHRHLLHTPAGEHCLLRFHNEVKITGRLNHAGVVSVYEFLVDHGQSYFVMEYVQGRELKNWLISQRFHYIDAVKVIIKLLDVLSYVHRKGVIHRDIKPANIFLEEDGGIKLTDFGIAHGENSDLTQVGSVLGTPNYMSPEQCAGNIVGYNTDLFSVGAVLYEMLTGHKPFDAAETNTVMQRVMSDKPKPFHAYSVKVPLSLEKIILKALDKNPHSRYLTADDFKLALIAAIGRSEKKTQKIQWIPLGVLASLLIVALLFYQVYFFTQKENDVLKEGVRASSLKSVNVKSDLTPTQLQYSQHEKVQRLLKVAGAHAKVGRLLSPVGSNAYEAYQLVLSIESQNQQAIKGLAAVKTAYLEKIGQLINEGRFTDAKIHIGTAREFFPQEEKELEKLAEKIKATP